MSSSSLGKLNWAQNSSCQRFALGEGDEEMLAVETEEVRREVGTGRIITADGESHTCASLLSSLPLALSWLLLIYICSGEYH